MLVSLLLALNRFYTLFWCFHSLLWTSKCRLGLGWLDPAGNFLGQINSKNTNKWILSSKIYNKHSRMVYILRCYISMHISFICLLSLFVNFEQDRLTLINFVQICYWRHSGDCIVYPVTYNTSLNLWSLKLATKLPELFKLVALLFNFEHI